MVKYVMFALLNQGSIFLQTLDKIPDNVPNKFINDGDRKSMHREHDAGFFCIRSTIQTTSTTRVYYVRSRNPYQVSRSILSGEGG